MENIFDRINTCVWFQSLHLKNPIVLGNLQSFRSCSDHLAATNLRAHDERQCHQVVMTSDTSLGPKQECHSQMGYTCAHPTQSHKVA